MDNYPTSDVSTSMVGKSSSSSVKAMMSSLRCRLAGPAVLSSEPMIVRLFLLLFSTLLVPRMAGMVGHVCARKCVWMDNP